MFLSQHIFSFPLYFPRIYLTIQNWPLFLTNYLSRRNRPSTYFFRNGYKIHDPIGTLTGTIAVVFVRREYGDMKRFKTIVDIGANMGAFSIYSAMSSKISNIYSFEPSPINYKILQFNIEQNSLSNAVNIFNSAIYSESGNKELSLGESPLHSFHQIGKNDTRITVKCITMHNIFDIVQNQNIDLLKLNCEGSEYKILSNLSPNDFYKIKNIRLEYHNLPNIKKGGLGLCHLLKKNEYKIKRFTRYRGVSGFIWATRV
jgi:FkbM family methyltransferase